ncbi:MAG TPA: DUF899 domain-containing protein [Povalibacter sp.]
MKPYPSAQPRVVSREEWLDARRALLVKEKDVTRLRDAVSAERRRLPMVRVDKDYVFEGPHGALRLIDMFEGRRQLYIHHFMWVDAADSGCPGCTQTADLNFTDINRAQLEERDVTLACISRAPFKKIDAYRRHRGWSFPWYSSHGNDFNYDFHVTLDESRVPIKYNYRSKQELRAMGFPDEMLRGDVPANSVFLRDEQTVYHTYSAFTRGLDHLFTPFNFLDLTPYGRQQDWEDSPEGWPQQPTRS